MDDGYGHPGIFLAAAAIAVIAGYLIWRYRKSKAENVTEEDIKTMVNEGHEQGVLESSEAEMISNIFEFDDKEAGDIMTHRKNIVALDGSMTVRDVLVHAENPGEAQTALRLVPGMLRSAHFIPETRNINSLFKEMQSQKIHMEIVIDEYGQTAGLVTMEDILEEIVGNILDEYDEDEQFIVRGTDGILTMSGMTPLEDAQEELGVTFPEEDLENYDTINGLLISRLDRIPGEEEKPEVQYQGYLFSVLKVENKMIASVRVTRLPEEDRETETSGEGTGEQEREETTE